MKPLRKLIIEDLRREYNSNFKPVKSARGSRISSLKEAKEDKEKLIQFAGQELADKFFKYKDRLKIEERNLYYWLKRDVRELEARISEIENTKTKSQLRREINQEGAEYLGSGKGYDVYHITTWEASRNLGRNAKWCISMENNPNYWRSYTGKGIKFYFFIGKNPFDKYALALYPKILEDLSGDLFEDKKSGNWYEIFEVNYELYNSEDNLNYQDAGRLPLDLIPEKVYSDIKQLKGSGENQELFIEGDELIRVNRKNINGDIIIPDNVTRIGGAAFQDCRNLTGITIPDGVISIGNYAFAGCNKLTGVIIPSTVTEIGGAAFQYCSELTNIILPNSVKDIGPGAFGYCSKLIDITIPDSVKSIEDYTFYECNSLTHITIPDDVTRIGKATFQYCDKLTSITIPDNITDIDSFAFYGCKSLTSIVIPKGVTKIGDYAFSECNRLTSTTIPDGVTRIGDGAFQNCNELTSIVIPSSVVNIDWRAFQNCDKLTIHCETKEQPKGWDEDWNPDNRPVVWGYKSKVNESLSKSANRLHFLSLKELKEDKEKLIRFADQIEESDKNQEFLIDSSGKLIRADKDIGKNITIPDNVTGIGDDAFYKCERLTGITIPDSVKSIGDGAFSDCSRLTDVIIGKGIKTIRDFAFAGCTNLTNIVIPDNVGKISDWAFDDCYNLKRIIIPDSIKSIGYGAFENCRNLTVYCEAKEQPRGWDKNWNPDNRLVIWGYKA